MSILATVTLKDTFDDENQPPAREAVAQVAHVLDDQGFRVIHEGLFGVSIEGEPADFQRVFGLSPEGQSSFSAEITDSIEELRDTVERLEVADERIDY
ncbi:hypothetical protein [Paraburkholderia sp. RL17-337-BIB-A]|uniref:hypothetical protein n=1 Tax=Paraburkholderia sp. RL17-337-BIB-A TaxID=3031636 RepID=UPI000E74A9B8